MSNRAWEFFYGSSCLRRIFNPKRARLQKVAVKRKETRARCATVSSRPNPSHRSGPNCVFQGRVQRAPFQRMLIAKRTARSSRSLKPRLPERLFACTGDAIF